jgi:hypothetical protein
LRKAESRRASAAELRRDRRSHHVRQVDRLAPGTVEQEGGDLRRGDRRAAIRRTHQMEEGDRLASGTFARYKTACERIGVWRSLVAHLVRDEGVAGSNPATPTNSFVVQPEDMDNAERVVERGRLLTAVCVQQAGSANEACGS